MATLISLIIPTFNRANFLDRALGSVAAARFHSPDQLEVIVVDNNSTDRTAKTVAGMKARFPYNLHCVTERNQGTSYARNRGLKEAKGCYVVFMDDDEVMEQHYLEHISTVFESTGAVCVGGPVVYYNALDLPHWLDGLSETIGQISFGDQARILGLDTHKGLSGGNIALIRSELIAAGGFNVHIGRVGNNLMTGEDYELQDRLRSSGKTIAYSPQLIQYHYLRPERFKKAYWREYYYEYGRGAYIRNFTESGSVRRSRWPIPVWLWMRLVARDLPAYLASFLTLDSFKQFRQELEIWTRMGQIREARHACRGTHCPPASDQVPAFHASPIASVEATPDGHPGKRPRKP